MSEAICPVCGSGMSRTAQMCRECCNRKRRERSQVREQARRAVACLREGGRVKLVIPDQVAAGLFSREEMEGR